MPDDVNWWNLLFFPPYNTRLVVVSVTLLGVAAGLAGAFLLLRKRSLMGDVLSHATLPGIGLAFLFAVAIGSDGKSLPVLLFGAVLSGSAGMMVVLAIRRTTHLHDDTAMGIVLSVFFGFGVVLLGLIQEMPGGSAAGLERFIYGKTASMVRQDLVLVAAVAAIVMACCLLLFKELRMLCFDEDFTSSQGWPALLLDGALLGLVTAVTVVGLQAVGLVLVIAFLIIPAAAARFWTHSLKVTLTLAALMGGISGWIGASLSSLLPGLPAGSVIVLAAASVFLFSLFFGSARGIVVRVRAHLRLQRRTGRQHLLRAAYELLEVTTAEGEPVRNAALEQEKLFAGRSWSRPHFRRLLRKTSRWGLAEFSGSSRFRLTEKGFMEAARVTRNHRLWEIYLIRYADIAPMHVDRDADMVEHVLGPELVRELEETLHRGRGTSAVPPSPHALSAEAAL